MFKKKKKKKNELKEYWAAEEILFLERLPQVIRDGVKHGQMHFIHFIHTPPHHRRHSFA